jgi:uncharacterized protein
MRVRERLESLVRLATRRPWLTVGLVVAVALAGGLLALGMQPSTGSDTFVSRGSATYQVTADDQAHFGGDPVVVMIREPLADLVLTKELATVTQLEACLAGQTVVANATLSAFTPAPAGSQPPYGGPHSPCAALMRMQPAQVVYGPGTFLNRSVAAVNTEVTTIENQSRQAVASAERSAYALAIGQGESKSQATKAASSAGTLEQENQNNRLTQMALQSGITSLPSIDNQDFISQVVFDATRGAYQPKARFAYLFPTTNSALIQVRLKASLSPGQQARAISLIRQAVKMPRFHSIYGGTYTVSGAPVVLDDLSSQLTHSITILLLGALAVMGITLILVFRNRLRLLPLLIALMATGITFGVTRLLGFTLTMASIAVLPILIGLAVDYAVQFQSRVAEGEPPGGGALNSLASAKLSGPRPTRREAVVQAALAGVPTIAVAALATATGFLVLLLSPVPMVRGFAVLLVIGIAIALACALLVGSAAMTIGTRRRDWGRAGAATRGAQDILAGLGTHAAAAGRGAVSILAAPVRRRRSRVPAASGGWLTRVLAAPWQILALGAVLAVLGWVADTQTSVQTDVTKLVPSGMPALHDLNQLERVTGVSGEIDVVVHADNVATPKTIGWMIRYEQGLFAHYGYLETRGCAHSTLCPALSLPDLFSAGAQSPSSLAASLSASSIDSLLKAVPPYFRQAVITPDRREATLAFGIRLMPLARQQQVIDYMRSQLHPPAGVTAGLAGLPVLAAEADNALSSSARRLLTLLAGLVAVGLALLVVLRRPERVIVPLVPIVLATGWSALILFLIGIPLNPMSATLGALVIAISTEFSVLLSERYRQERQAGGGLAQALHRAYASTGRAVIASGITAIAGFGVLVLSNITMLRDFGFVTLIDLTVSLAGVLLVLPAVLALSEREDLVDDVRGKARERFAALPRPRRRRVAVEPANAGSLGGSAAQNLRAKG